LHPPPVQLSQPLSILAGFPCCCCQTEVWAGCKKHPRFCCQKPVALLETRRWGWQRPWDGLHPPGILLASLGGCDRGPASSLTGPGEDATAEPEKLGEAAAEVPHFPAETGSGHCHRPGEAG